MRMTFHECVLIPSCGTSSPRDLVASRCLSESGSLSRTSLSSPLELDSPAMCTSPNILSLEKITHTQQSQEKTYLVHTDSRHTMEKEMFPYILVGGICGARSSLLLNNSFPTELLRKDSAIPNAAAPEFKSFKF